MAFFLILFLFLASFALSEIMRTNPKTEKQRPAGLGDFNFPTATEGRSVPILWGTCKIDGPNVVWYGDLSSEKIKKKVKSGLFSSTTQTLGFQYFLGLQFAFCRGEVDFIRTIWVNDKVLWSGKQAAGLITLDAPSLFGDEKTGPGGITGPFRFYTGSRTQAVNTYLQDKVGTVGSIMFKEDFSKGTNGVLLDFYPLGDGFIGVVQLGGFSYLKGVIVIDATTPMTHDVVNDLWTSNFTYFECVNNTTVLVSEANAPHTLDTGGTSDWAFVTYLGSPRWDWPGYGALPDGSVGVNITAIGLNLRAMDGKAQTSPDQTATGTSTVHLRTGGATIDTFDPDPPAYVAGKLIASNRPRASDNFSAKMTFVIADTNIRGGYGFIVKGSSDFYRGNPTGNTGSPNDLSFGGTGPTSGVALSVSKISGTWSFRVWYKEPGLGSGMGIDIDRFTTVAIGGVADGAQHTLEMQIKDNERIRVLYDGAIVLDWKPILPSTDTKVLSLFPREDDNVFLFMDPYANQAISGVNGNSGIYAFQVGGVAAAVPAYRGTSYGVLEHGYVGNSTSINPWGFEITRIPAKTLLGDAASLNDGYDANPVGCLYEILTDTDWGLGFPTADIDEDSFTSAANTLAAELNGFSLVLDTPQQAVDMITEIERQIDGVVYLDRPTGKWKIQLIREEGPFLTLDNTSLIEIKEFTHGAWEETTNQVQVKYHERTKYYNETYAMAQDSANVRIQGGTVIAGQPEYPGVKTRKNANRIAWRDLRTLSCPLATAKLVVDRSFSILWPGSAFAWTDPQLGVSLQMRITRMDMGKLEEGLIEVDCVQDVFGSDDGSFADPPSSLWVDPNQTPADIAAVDRLVFEAPKAFCDHAEVLPAEYGRVWSGGRYQQDNGNSFNVYISDNGGAYKFGTTVESYILAGKLALAMDNSSAEGVKNILLTPDPDSEATILKNLDSHSAVEIGQNLFNLAMVDSEIVGFESAVDDGSGNVSLRRVYRGLLDTTRAAHAINTRVWLLGTGGNISDTKYKDSHPLTVKLLNKSSTATMSLQDATVSSFTTANRAVRPYPPTSITVNATGWPTVNVDMDHQSGATLDTRGLSVTFTRKDWRTTDEVAAANSDESDLPSDHVSAYSTAYASDVVNDPAGVNALLFTTAFNDGSGSMFISRTKIYRYNAGVRPTTLKLKLKAHHTFEATLLESTYTLDQTFTVTSALTNGDTNMGVVANGVSSSSYTAVATGTFTLNIGTALTTGAVQVELNGSGVWNTVIAATATTGTFAVTTGNTIKVRHQQAGANTSETFCELVNPSATSVAYAILTY